MCAGGPADPAGGAARLCLRHHQPFYADHSRWSPVSGTWRVGIGAGVVAGTKALAATVSASGKSAAISAGTRPEQQPERPQHSHRALAVSPHGWEISRGQVWS